MNLDPPSVYVGFSSGKGFVARAIQFFSGGRANHAFLYYRAPVWNCWVDHGAVSGGFIAQFAGKDEPLLGSETWELWRAPAEIRIGMEKNADKLGAPYDWSGLVGMLPVEIAQHAFKQRIGNPMETRRAMFCSEIVSRIVADSGVVLPFADGERASTTDPSELREAIARAGWERVYCRAPEPENLIEIPEAEWVGEKDEPGDVSRGG